MKTIQIPVADFIKIASALLNKKTVFDYGSVALFLNSQLVRFKSESLLYILYIVRVLFGQNYGAWNMTLTFDAMGHYKGSVSFTTH